MTLLKWLNSITNDLFATAERPLFLVTNQIANEDFANFTCHLLATLGADVVFLNGDSRCNDYNIHYCDGIINLALASKGVELKFIKNHLQNYKLQTHFVLKFELLNNYANHYGTSHRFF